MAGMTRRGVLPEVGQTVYLDASASPQFKARPVRLLLTEPPAPSTLDHTAGRPAERAVWLHLTGWELGPRREHVELRHLLMAKADGVVLIVPRAVRDDTPRGRKRTRLA
jgi:hypothetical protein